MEEALGLGLGGTGDAKHLKYLQDTIRKLVTERNNLQVEVRKHVFNGRSAVAV